MTLEGKNAAVHAEYDHPVLDFLVRAGVPAEQLGLAGAEVAGAIWSWLESRGF